MLQRAGGRGPVAAETEELAGVAEKPRAADDGPS